MSGVDLRNEDRRGLLEQHGRFYGEQRLAVLFTETNRARHEDDTRPKEVTTRAWQTTQPLRGPVAGAALLTSRGQHRNVAINLRGSLLVGIECDGDDDLARVKELGLPATLTEQTSLPSKLHFYFRPPTIDTIPKVGFRFEAGRLHADTNRYFVCAPSIHPTGRIYSFLPGFGPGEVEIASLPEEIYLRLLEDAGAESTRQTASSGPISAGDRHEHLRRLSYAMRRYAGASLEALEAALLAENSARCTPPKEERLVRALASYTHAHVDPKGPNR